MSSTSASNTKSPLEVAQNIVAELTGLTSDHQSLAIKFACETLGLQLPAAMLPSVAPIIHSTQQPTQHAAVSADHSTDIRSFTAMKAPKSDQQFTAVVAYFYQFEARPDDKKETIDAETMKEAARLAGRPQVERWNMTLTNAKNAGYLDAAGNGKFKLSSVGENLVAITLPNDSGPVQGKSSRKLRVMSKKRNVKKKK